MNPAWRSAFGWFRCLAALAVLTVAPAARGGTPESEARAAMVVNFIRYVQWPDNPAPDAEVRICVAGQGATANALLAYDGRSINGRRIAVESRLYSPPSGTYCRLLYVGEAGGRRPIDWLKDVFGQPVLTVSEGEDFVPSGGVVSLTQAAGQPAFDINLAAMRKSNLRIGSQLLRLARDLHGK